MGFLSGITDVFKDVGDTLFGDPNQSLNAQQKSNNRSQEFIEEQTGIARDDVNRLYRQSQQPLQQGYQAAIDAMGGTARQQIDTTARGNYYGQEALLAGLPQFQNAILGNPVDNSTMQPKILHPERNLDWLFNTTLGARTGGHEPISQTDAEVLRELTDAGLGMQQIRDLNSANQTFKAQGADNPRTLEEIFNAIYGGA